MCVLDVMTGQLGLIRTLRGLTPVFGSFGSEELDEHRLEQHLQSDPELARAACWYWIRKLQASCLLGRARSRRSHGGEGTTISVDGQRRLPGGGISLLWRAGPGRRCRCGDPGRTAGAARGCRRAITRDFSNGRRTVLRISTAARRWSAQRSPVVEGRELDAERLYEQAIRSARVNGFVHIEALANELAGRFYGARGFETSASAHLKEARHCYLRWGADGKVRQLDELYPHLEPGRTRCPTRARPSASTSSTWSSQQSSRPYKLCPARSCSNA